MSPGNRKLKNFFIYPVFLSKSALFFALVVVNVLLGAMAALQHSPNEGVSLLIMIGVIVVAGLMSVWYIHRVTGPMRAICRTCDLVRDGKTEERIVLRPGDEFSDVAVAINGMLNALLESKKS